MGARKGLYIGLWVGLVVRASGWGEGLVGLRLPPQTAIANRLMTAVVVGVVVFFDELMDVFLIDIIHCFRAAQDVSS